MYELVHAERASFPVSFSCRVGGGSRSGYYRWLKAELSARARSDVELAAEIEEIHTEHKGRYGSPRIHRELRDRGRRVGRRRIARLMRERGLRGRLRRRFRRTTDSRHGHHIARNLLERDFTAAAPNQDPSEGKQTTVSREAEPLARRELERGSFPCCPETGSTLHARGIIRSLRQVRRTAGTREGRGRAAALIRAVEGVSTSIPPSSRAGQTSMFRHERLLAPAVVS